MDTFTFANPSDSLTTPFVRTKLRPPRLRTDTLHRPRLVQTIHQAIANARLVLVSAPAGYGKTTLVAHAVSQFTGVRSAWLTLDNEDDEPCRFLNAFIAALQPIAPAFATFTAGLLTANNMGGQRDIMALGRTVMTALINEIFENEQPICMVLDDLHYTVNEAIYAFLTFLVERLPSNMTLLIATRHDPALPLAQLRARRELVELRLEELRFTPAEATTLLNQHLGLALTAHELDALMKRTEGWAAGMTLISASLARLASPSARGAFFEQVAHSSRYLFDYLAEAVLNREEPVVQNFLVATAILETLTPDLCNAVTGRTDAAELLDHLYHRNLFLIGLDALGPSGQSAYRYHDLFGDFLQERLRREPAAIVCGWHQRAAAAIDLPASKIHHYIQAQAWEQALRLIEEAGPQLINDNAWRPLLAWITALPEAVREERPLLHRLLGAIATTRWEMADALRHLNKAIEQFAAQGNRAAQGEALVALATVYNLLGNVTTAVEITERSLTMPISPASRVLLLTGRVWQRMLANDAAQVCADLDEAICLIETVSVGAVQQQTNEQALTYLALGLRASVVAMPGALEQTERFVRLAEKLGPKENVLITASLAFLRSMIAFWRDQWEVAEWECVEALALEKKAGGFATMGVEVESLFQKAVRSAMQGDWPHAEPLFTRFFQALAAQGDVQRDWLPPALSCYARACWVNKRYPELYTAYQQMLDAPLPARMPFRQLFIDEVKALILLSEGRAKEAKRVMQAVLTNRPESPLLRFFGEARLTLAYICLQAGDQQGALAALAPVLAMVQQENIPGQLHAQGLPMVLPLLHLAVERDLQPQFAQELLARFDLNSAAVAPLKPAIMTSESFRIPDTGETLTAREIEVLRLIARGAENAAIATELVVSIHTVKTHVVHILGKLGVSSRMAAAIKARELGVVDL